MLSICKGRELNFFFLTQAQAALAKTQEKISESVAQQQKSAIELAVERVRRQAKEQLDRVHTKLIKNDELVDKQEKIM